LASSTYTKPSMFLICQPLSKCLYFIMACDISMLANKLMKN
jgi:hypothetical protein